ncbi:MAG: dethiobiotin synthase [Desulfuromonadales bacterium]|nr:dethiobiotin synthase [Desulfuromonadales bacterium]
MSAELACPALFVTGTDTGVGKTIVAAALARFCSDRGLAVGVMKPVETGVDDPAQPGADARLLRWAARATDADALLAPYRLSQPIAPDQAARADGVCIDPALIAARLTELSQGKDLLLVEGAGGLMVPLRGGYLIADLIRDLELPVLLVTHPRLGTINHTLLTTFAARGMHLDLAGLIINRMPDQPGLAEKEAPHSLAALASADLLAVLPEASGNSEQQVAALAEELRQIPTLPWLLNALGIGEKR